MPERAFDRGVLRGLLHTSAASPGVFGRAVGFGSGTGSYKEVHLMNDLAQCVLGGGPAHRGDLLCLLIREEMQAKEPTGDAAMRAASGVVGETYGRAYPPSLGADRISALREAARRVVAFDGGIYQARASMASGLATHRSLLGAEGFRRLQIGRYLEAVLGPSGRARLRELYESPSDPVSRFLRPVMIDGGLEERHPAPEWLAEPTAYDEALGRRLTTLLAHPLSKPTVLRLFALSVSLGLTLRVLGAGAEGGRPTMLVLPSEAPSGKRHLREEAVQCVQRGLDGLDRRLAELLAEHPRAAELWEEPGEGADVFHATASTDVASSAAAIIQAARLQPAPKDAKGIYWPDGFVMPLARRSGCVRPRSKRAGWKPYMVLTPDHLEALILMAVPPGAPPLPWGELWGQLRADLGLIIGARGHSDAEALRAAGVLHVNMQHLAENSRELLAQAVERGVARRLPDSGAEAGGELT